MKNISKWLQKRSVPVKQISENHWLLPLEHDGAAYSLTIREIGDWFSYGAELMADVEGEKSDEFYRKILDLNRILNGAHIAKEGDKLILLHNDLTSHINEEELIKYLAIFHHSHEYVLKEILNEGAELGVKFKT